MRASSRSPLMNIRDVHAESTDGLSESQALLFTTVSELTVRGQHHSSFTSELTNILTFIF